MTQAEIDQAIKDQIGTNPEEPLPSNPDIPGALANYAAEAARVAAVLNLQSNLPDQLSELVAVTDPPHPQVGYWAATASDGWTYVIHGGDSVMAMPPIPQVPTAGPAGVVAIDSRIANPNFWAALPQDSAPANYTTPSPTTTRDGVVGFFIHQGVFPLGGWWEKVG